MEFQMKLKRFLKQETVLSVAAVLAVLSMFFGAAGCRLPRLHRPAHARYSIFPNDHHGRTAAGRAFLTGGAGAVGTDRQHLAAGARSGRAVLLREHDHHQRRFPADLCPLYLCGAERPCAGHPPGADHPSGVHADHRGQPWQYAHAHRQPTEPLPLRQKRNEHGGVPPAHVPLHGRFAAASGGLAVAVCRKQASSCIGALPEQPNTTADRKIILLDVVLFAVCLLAVVRVLPYGVAFAAVLVCTLCADRSTLRNVDYSLLLTFVAFFVFIGNLGRIPAFSGWLQAILAGQEVLVAVLASQVTSNVPAALLLSGFTDEPPRLSSARISAALAP